MNPLAALRRWWQRWTGEDETPLDGDTPAWLVSFAIHLVALFSLAAIVGSAATGPTTVELTTAPEELPPPPDHFEASPVAQTEIGSNSAAGAEVAAAVAPRLDLVSRVVIEEPPRPEFKPVVKPTVWETSTAPDLTDDAPIKGTAGVGATGSSGAVDQLVYEIDQSLQQRPTLVVWLFDQSLSMQAQREAISKRFSRIYQELEALGHTRDDALLGAVMAFGQNVFFPVEEPTADAEVLKEAVLKIENDPSGLENVFSAVGAAVDKYKSFRTRLPRRNVMLVIVSDESGDDADAGLERAIDACRRYEMPVYVVGVPAPFGRRQVEIKYVDPDPAFDQSPRWLPVDQGPESFMPEGILLAFSGATRGDEYDRLDSGFGPYALTRLCYESSGIYFMVHPNRETVDRRVGPAETGVMASNLSRFFDPGIMRSYQPDYVSVQEYQELLRQNKARMALVMAAQQSQLQPMQNPTLEFPKAEEGEFKRMLDTAQQQAALLDFQLAPLYNLLVEGERDREHLTQPRWKAGFDLAMGRVLAVKARTESYNAMLAKAKGGLAFQNPENDTFVLVPADDASINSAVEKTAAKAREHLERVLREHAGTPWALLAERELREPIGWRWSEKRVNLPPRPQGAPAPGGEPAPPQDQLNRLPKPKPARDIRL